MNNRIQTAIFGAGQAGAMIRTWLPANTNLICFIDNNTKKQGTAFCGFPVLSMKDALKKRLDLIWIAVLNREAEETIRKQLVHGGYHGEIRSANEVKSCLDLRLSGLRLIAEDILRRDVQGAVAELGVYQGDFATQINLLLPDRELYLFDTFEGFDERDLQVEDAFNRTEQRNRDFVDTSEALVLEKLTRPDKAHIVKGYFPESLCQIQEDEPIRYAFVSIDPDLYEPVKNGLEYFYPAMNPGGVIMIHDYNSLQFSNVKRAVDEYCRDRGIVPVPLMDLHGSAIIVKQ